MIKFEVTFADASLEECKALDEFWRAGFGRAEGFRWNGASTINIKSPAVTTYQRPSSRREIAERILKAIKEGS